MDTDLICPLCVNGICYMSGILAPVRILPQGVVHGINCLPFGCTGSGRGWIVWGCERAVYVLANVVLALGFVSGLESVRSGIEYLMLMSGIGWE